MKKVHSVKLSQAERDQLDQLVRSGVSPARTITHARILLKSDEGEHASGAAWTDPAIADALGCGASTVARVRKQYATGGMEAALHRKKSGRIYERKLDGRGEAHLVALCCSEPPQGLRWSLRLLSERVVELGLVEAFSHESVRQVLKKTNSSLTASSSG